MMIMRTRIMSGLRYSSALFYKSYTQSIVPKTTYAPPFRLFSDTLPTRERDKHSGVINYDNESEDKVEDIEKDMVDENTDVCSNQIDLFENWRNPHTQFVEETLNQLEIKNINPFTIYLFCQNIEDKTDDEIAQFFAKASVYYNDTDMNLDKDPDIKTLINAVIKRAHALSYDNLLVCVRALNSWPEALRVRSGQLRFQVPSDHHQQINLLYDCLRDESNHRISGSRASQDVFISVASAGMAKAFQLVDAWLPIDRVRRGWFKSFPVEVVHRIANQERGSIRKMKPMDKDLFVDFMRICGEIGSLRPSFHKYYCTVKFVDFLPIMNEDEIGTVCRTFISCNLVGHVKHPMEIKLKTLILMFAKDNIYTIKSPNLNSIMCHISTAMPRNFHQDILDLQKLMVDDGVMEKMELRTLITLAGMGIREHMFTRKGIYPPFMDQLVTAILSSDRTSDRCDMEAWHFKTISAVTALHHDTSPAREACQKLQRNVVECQETRQQLRIAQGMLHMAHLGLYDQEALDWLFSSDKISKVWGREGQERRLLSKIMFSANGGICSLGHVLMKLQGMVQTECPEYRGALITWEMDKLLKHFMHSSTPLQVFEKGPSHLLSRYWVMKGLQLHHLLCHLVGGERFVGESYVLPFTSQINYVILFDNLGRPKEIPDWFRSLPETQAKVVEEGEGQWVMFSMLHPKQDAVMMMTGGGRVIDRLARRVGFTNVTVDLGVLEDLEETTEDKMVEYLRDQLSIKCPVFQSPQQHQTKCAVQP